MFALIGGRVCVLLCLVRFGLGTVVVVCVGVCCGAMKLLLLWCVCRAVMCCVVDVCFVRLCFVSAVMLCAVVLVLCVMCCVCG